MCRVRLIFQPAEEGTRGGGAMVATGVCEVVGGATAFLATTRFIATFRGTASHAGLAPEVGRSALLAAAQAVLALHSLPQHADGRTRVNAGVMHSGAATNIVPAEAVLEFETRSDVTAVNTYLEERARKAVADAAATFGCSVRRSGHLRHHRVGPACHPSQ